MLGIHHGVSDRVHNNKAKSASTTIMSLTTAFPEPSGASSQPRQHVPARDSAHKTMQLFMEVRHPYNRRHGARPARGLGRALRCFVDFVAFHRTIAMYSTPSAQQHGFTTCVAKKWLKKWSCITVQPLHDTVQLALGVEFQFRDFGRRTSSGYPRALRMLRPFTAPSAQHTLHS